MIRYYIERCFKIWKDSGLKHIVISPGSRSAPLTIACEAESSFKKFVIPDERSAAFFALGIAQASKTPVVLICTSGSAVYNYAPAVSEAYFSKSPLVVCSADRPEEWIDQYDGQTIFQNGIFGKHVKQSYTMPTEVVEVNDLTTVLEIAHKSWTNAIENGKEGPVHINWPFREPLYKYESLLKQSEIEKVLNQWSSEVSEERFLPFETQAPQGPGAANVSGVELSIEDFKSLIEKHKKILIVGGQEPLDVSFTNELKKIHSDNKAVVISDLLSNTGAAEGILNSDVWLRTFAKETIENQELSSIGKSLVPDLLITFGKSIISKQTKLFLRNHFDGIHIHVGIEDRHQDPYRTNMQFVKQKKEVITYCFKEIKVNKVNVDFSDLWKIEDSKISAFYEEQIPLLNRMSDALVVHTVLNEIKSETVVHCANSLPVRYVNFFNSTYPNVEFNANRGTSGIDGSVSTANGWATYDTESKERKTRQHLLITGDLSFFYDRNAWWNSYTNNGLKVLVINNLGGGIFDMIPGPKTTNNHEHYFVTEQNMSAQYLAQEYKIDYYSINDDTLDWKIKIKDWMAKKGQSILEVFTDRIYNKEVFEHLFIRK